MYTIGLIKTERPDVLINPVGCSTTREIYTWLDSHFNAVDFALSTSAIQEAVEQVGQTDALCQINLNGYEVALLLGKDEVIQERTTRYIHLVPRLESDVDVDKIHNLIIPD